MSTLRVIMKEFITHSAEETTALGRKLAVELKPGTTDLLRGDLGAGKTTPLRLIASPAQRLLSSTNTAGRR